MSSAGRVRVMVVDDQPGLRCVLKDVLEASGRVEVVGLARDGEDAVRTVQELRPEVIVMDLVMPRKDGVEACREIMELLPDTRVLMLTASADIDAVVVAIAAGAAGYIQKFSPPQELVEAVLDVAEGHLRVPDVAAREVYAMIRGGRDPVPCEASDKLTALERETLTLFASGLSYIQISEVRGSSATAIQNTLDCIQDKLGLKTRQELAIWAVKNGLLDRAEQGG